MSEVAQETVQDTSQQEDTAEAAEGTPIAKALSGDTSTSLTADITVAPTLVENTSDVSIASIDVEASANAVVNVEISGADSDKVTYNTETQEIILVSGLDYENDDTLEITVSISDDFGNSQSDNIVISVTDQNEAPSLVAVENNNFCLLYTSPSPRDGRISRMPSSA